MSVVFVHRLCRTRHVHTQIQINCESNDLYIFVFIHTDMIETTRSLITNQISYAALKLLGLHEHALTDAHHGVTSYIDKERLHTADVDKEMNT